MCAGNPHVPAFRRQWKTDDWMGLDSKDANCVVFFFVVAAANSSDYAEKT